jgi:hypothetical protein
MINCAMFFKVFGGSMINCLNSARNARTSLGALLKLFFELSPDPGGKATAGCNKGRALSKVR